MGFLDKFKNKTEQKKASKEPNVLDMVKESPSAKVSEDREKIVEQKIILKENTGRAHHVLHRSHLSEKTNQLSAIGRYVFKVAKTANKIEVRKAIEGVYDVHVTAVNMINVSGKKRRQGKSIGRTQDWKKAIVTLKEGESISGLAEGV